MRCAKPLSAWACPTGARFSPSPSSTASPGIITGCMLAFARVAGETAPLIFTALGNRVLEHQPQRAHRRASAADLRLCDLSLRRSAPAGVGGCAGFDCSDCARRFAGPLCHQPRRFERGKLSGRRHRGNKPERVVRHQSHAAGHQSEYPRQPRHGADRSLRLRQKHLRALPQPHARNQSHRPRHRHRPHRRPRHLRGRQAGRDSPPRRHGLPAPQSFSHHVHLRQRRCRPQAQRLLQPPCPR